MEETAKLSVAVAAGFVGAMLNFLSLDALRVYFFLCPHMMSVYLFFGDVVFRPACGTSQQVLPEQSNWKVQLFTPYFFGCPILFFLFCAFFFRLASGTCS